jgi:hypothetical protein
MKKWFKCLGSVVRKGIGLPFIVFVLHEICAHVAGNLYDLWPPLDIPMHFLGGVAIAYFGAVFLKQCSAYGFVQIHSELMTLALILALTLSAATLWEYAEWISDRVLGTQAQKGLDDTLLDTVVGLCGGILFVLVSRGKLLSQELFQVQD